LSTALKHAQVERMMSRVVVILVALALKPLGLLGQNTAQEYQRACDGGDLVACTVVGLIYETGAGGTRDVPRAVSLYQRSCARGVIAACQRLGLTELADSAVAPTDELVRVGYIADAYDGSALAGALVRIRGIPGVGEHRYLADESGRVVLDQLPRGRHAIEVQRGGYQWTEGLLPVPWETDFLILMERVQEEETPALGQIFGQVTEEGSTRGISDVDITVRGAATARTISNREGRFQLSDLPPGPIELEFTRLGYEPRVANLTVQRGRTVEVYASMATQPVELEPVEVAVASRYLERTGFYRRARNVTGDRFTYRDIAQMNVMMVSDVVRRVGGVTVLTAQNGGGSEAVSNRRRVDADFGRCRMRPYLDGIPLVNFNLELVPPDEIEALEVYHGANVPVEYFDEFQQAGPSCGVILIWTRDPVRRD
jgi:hypothetical protein